MDNFITDPAMIMFFAYSIEEKYNVNIGLKIM